MTTKHYAAEDFIDGCIALASDTGQLHERHGSEQGSPFLKLNSVDDLSVPAGHLRLWEAATDSPLDRMVYLNLLSGPVSTQLLFVFGKADSTFPHIHVQMVRFPPNGLVYNVDILPRLDAIDHFNWHQRVYSPLRRSYRKAVTNSDNSCAQAPANPLLAALMSPWGIASQRTDATEFERVAPQLSEYLEHYFRLSAQQDWQTAPPEQQRDRDARHMQLFLSDELDQRAWAGVYRVVGESIGKQIKGHLARPLA